MMCFINNALWKTLSERRDEENQGIVEASEYERERHFSRQLDGIVSKFVDVHRDVKFPVTALGELEARNRRLQYFSD